MRSPKLTPAIMAAAALLVLATAGSAAAAKKPKHAATGTGTCHGVKLAVAPRLITSGEPVLAYGQAACSPVEGQTVTIYDRPFGSPAFGVAGTATTDSKGLYQATITGLTTNTAFYAVAGGAQSIHRQVKVATTVQVEGPPEGKPVFTGFKNAVTFKGTVSPNDGGAVAVLQRQNSTRGTEWGPIQRTIVDREGHFSFTHPFAFPGASSFRVVIRGSHRNVSSFSNVLSYTVAQAENPLLKIESSLDPIASGGTAAVKDVAPGLPVGTVLTLQGRPAHGRFANIATTQTTDAAGDYAFPAQKPAVSTFYRVTGAGRTSAVLYEGVKYILTATPAATTVSEGQPIVFTGTVTPAKAGHTIYLEKQNIFGTGFHPVAVGTVAGDGSYTLSRAFFAPGTDVLRVKIPGDPEFGGTPSPPVTITVTASSTEKIPAEAPGNGTLPPEGKL
ncbi:MAG: Ig-like domain-containing protein [Solirubrobacteraceae bacterium]